MDCPACSAKLLTLKVGDIELEACQNGCGGLWFDQDELIKFDEPHEFSASPILKLAKEKELASVDPEKKKICPKCESEPLVRQFLDPDNQLEIDQCWSCAGIWFDVGEINQLRGQFETCEDRAKAVNDYVSKILEQSAQAMEANTKGQLAEYKGRVMGRMASLGHAMSELLTADHPLDV